MGELVRSDDSIGIVIDKVSQLRLKAPEVHLGNFLAVGICDVRYAESLLDAEADQPLRKDIARVKQGNGP